jgi:hypothetical protein
VVADFDGRAGVERAWIGEAPHQRRDCRRWLVVEGSSGRTGAPISGTDPFTSSTLGLPSVSGTAGIDDLPGAEILVDVTAGASTTLMAVFAFRDGDVIKVRASGPGAPQAGLFPYGGSVGRLYAVDCAGPARVVVSEARAGVRRYTVRRRVLEARGAVWRSLPGRTQRGTARPRQLSQRWPEFRSSPFLSCAT